MNRNQEILEISRLVFELTMTGSMGTDLDDLMQRLFGVLANLPSIRVRQQGAILLFSQALVQVTQFGLGHQDRTDASSSPLDGLSPDFRLAPYITTLREERGGFLRKGEQDARFMVLSMTGEARPLGLLLVFIEPDWAPDAIEMEFMTDLGRAMAGLVMRSLINETLRVRELELEDARTDAIRRLGAASEYRDNETGMHVMRMTNFASVIAKAMGLPEDLREILFITAPMHDVGKIGIADAILLKPGKLSVEEFDTMKTHTEIGGRILKGEDALIVAAREIAISHHEHWDGSGYPSGLKGEEIPVLARVCAIADVFDALTSSRPYKVAWPLEQTLDWIHGETGKKFDPAVVAAFDRALPEILRIRELYRDEIIDPNQVVDLPEIKCGETRWVDWDESLSIGIDIIDAHHRFLLELINDLHDIVANKRGSRELGRVLKALDKYAQVHFRAEERMMERHAFSGLERQRQQHHHFEKKLRDFYEELHVNPLTAQFDMLTYLRDWLIRHIRHEDSRLRELVSAAV